MKGDLAVKKTIQKHNELDYIISVPDDFSEEKIYPAVIFLHGAGGRGRNIEMIETNPYFQITDKYELEMVTFAPQCYANSWFDIFEQLSDFVNDMLKNKYVDKDRVYVAGASMGGYATWQMAMAHPELFAAIVPVCGGGMYWNAGRLKDMGVWAYHGSEDPVVFPEESRKMVDAVNNAGGHAKLTICDGVSHNSWINAYSNRELFDWLMSQKRSDYHSEEDKYNNQEDFG